MLRTHSMRALASSSRHRFFVMPLLRPGATHTVMAREVTVSPPAALGVPRTFAAK